MWSAVCSSALQLQFVESTKPYLCIVERNSPMPVRRWFSLTHEDLRMVRPSRSFLVVRGQEEMCGGEGYFLPFRIPFMICPLNYSGIGLI